MGAKFYMTPAKKENFIILFQKLTMSGTLDEMIDEDLQDQMEVESPEEVQHTTNFCFPFPRSPTLYLSI